MPVVDLAVLPDRIGERTPPVAVVFDVLRATTMMAALIEAGAKGIRAVGGVDRARAFRDAEPGLLLAGEVGGVPPASFDLGNSPARIDPAMVRDRVVVMATTNGTRAVERAAGAGVCLMAALTNLDAVAERLIELGRDTLLVCSGTDGGRSDEDELAAGMLVERLRGWTASDAAEDAADRATGSIGASGGIPAAVRRSWHAQRLIDLGYEDDVRFCSQLSITPVVPTLDAARGLIVRG